MPTLKLPIAGSAYKNVDEAALQDRSAFLMDGFVDESGATNKRPGLKMWTVIGNDPIDGLFWWDKAGIVIATSNGRVYRINPVTTSAIDITGALLLDQLSGGLGNRTSFVAFTQAGEDYLMLANGGDLLVYGGAYTTTTKVNTLPTDPHDITSLAFIDTFVLCTQKNNPQIRFSAVGDAFTFPPLNFFTAESDPDFPSRIKVAWREIMVTGRRSIEAWFNQGVTPFERLEGAFIQMGVLAPNTFLDLAGSWIWLNNDRKLVVTQGRNPMIMSTPFDKELGRLEHLEDAFADVIQIAGRTFYVMSCPTHDKTYVFDVTQAQSPKGPDGWAEWSFYNQVTAQHERWRGSCYCYATSLGKHLVGDRNDGVIYTLDPDYPGDTAAPYLIRCVRRTGHISHGTTMSKRNVRLRIRMKRGLGNSDVIDPRLILRWRDQNGPWKPEITIPLGKVGEDEYVAELFALGIYRARQYEFIQSELCPLVLVDAEEDFDILMR